MRRSKLLNRNITGRPPAVRLRSRQATRRALSDEIRAARNRRKCCALNRAYAHNDAPVVRVEALTNKGAHYRTGAVRIGCCAPGGLRATASARGDNICRERRLRAKCDDGACALLAFDAHIAAGHTGRSAQQIVDSAHENVRSQQPSRSKSHTRGIRSAAVTFLPRKNPQTRRGFSPVRKWNGWHQASAIRQLSPSRTAAMISS